MSGSFTGEEKNPWAMFSVSPFSKCRVAQRLNYGIRIEQNRSVILILWTYIPAEKDNITFLSSPSWFVVSFPNAKKVRHVQQFRLT